MKPVIRWSGLVAATFVVLAAGPSAPKAKRTLLPFPVEIEAQEIPAFNLAEPLQRRFGALEFRGGLVLTSKERTFGGISGLHITADGKGFVAHTDRGIWLRGKLKLDGDRITGIAGAEMAPMLGVGGRPLAATNTFDTEALAVDGENFYVGVERVNQILRFRFGREGFGAVGIPIAIPRAIRDLPHNQGLEALAFVPKAMPLAGTLIAVSERGLDANGNIVAFLLGGPSPGTFAVRRSKNFDITDAAISPSGHLVLLERYFTIMTGVQMRIRAIPLGEIRPGALVEGITLIEAGPAFQIDNMEALAITKNAAGETILTIVSDNNFSPIQRTLLLRFAWIDQPN